MRRVSPSRTCFLNPEAVIVTLYGPLASDGTRNSPSEFVTLDNSTFVSVWTIVICAFGTVRRSDP